MNCPSCGREGDGRFCSECGAPLQGAACRSCGAALEPGARFCNECGLPSGVSAPLRRNPRQSSNTAWYLAAAVLLVMIVAILVPMVLEDDVAPAPGEAAPASGVEAPFANGATGSPPPLSDDMRVNADRLFNRIMEIRETGDPAEAAQFYPMAIQAYQAAEPLDADGLYHLSLIQAAAGDLAAGRETAERILDMAPNHLLALGAAGEASVEMGDTAAARAYYTRFLENYETERTNQYPEYIDHARILPAYEQQARMVTGR